MVLSVHKYSNRVKPNISTPRRTVLYIAGLRPPLRLGEVTACRRRSFLSPRADAASLPGTGPSWPTGDTADSPLPWAPGQLCSPKDIISWWTANHKHTGRPHGGRGGWLMALSSRRGWSDTTLFICFASYTLSLLMGRYRPLTKPSIPKQSFSQSIQVFQNIILNV